MHPLKVFRLAAVLVLASPSFTYAQGRPPVREPPEGEEETPPTRQEPARPEPRDAFRVDEALADRGAMLWMTKGCDVCHGIGQGRLAGPDLLHVTARRDMDWLRRFIRDPRAMAQTDEQAQALIRGYNNIIMPDLGLHEEQITALLHFLARESRDEMGESNETS
jgi:protein SCO1/2